MPFDWREYLTLAQYLQGQGSGHFSQEAGLRCAVSRAYYAAFCHSRNYARDHHGFLPTHSPNEHGLVRRHYQGRGDIAIASNLDLLRQWRNQCDYADSVSDVALILVGAIAGAHKIFESLR